MTEHTIGKLVVNLDTRSVDVDGQRLDVTSSEYRTLELLSLRKGTTVTREMLLDFLCDSTGGLEFMPVALIIARLRKKIATATGGPDYIETLWGRGYVLKDPAPPV